MKWLTFRKTRALASGLFSWKKIQSSYYYISVLKALSFMPETDNPKNETFEQAAKRLNVNDEQIISVKRQSLIYSGLGFFGTLIFLSAAIAEMSRADSFFGVVTGLCFFATVSMPAAFYIKWTFRYWQIKNRRLGGFGEWLRTPSAWLPI